MEIESTQRAFSFLPESWDDKAAAGKAAAEIRARRTRSTIPDEVRHREKWRLALDMLDEITATHHATDTTFQYVMWFSSRVRNPLP